MGGVDGFIPNPKLRLREQVREVIRFKHYSIRTEAMYWHWIRRYILFHGKKHPRDLHAPDVRTFLTHLAAHENVAAATQSERSAVRGFRVHVRSVATGCELPSAARGFCRVKPRWRAPRATLRP